MMPDKKKMLNDYFKYGIGQRELVEKYHKDYPNILKNQFYCSFDGSTKEEEKQIRDYVPTEEDKKRLRDLADRIDQDILDEWMIRQ